MFFFFFTHFPLFYVCCLNADVLFFCPINCEMQYRVDGGDCSTVYVLICGRIHSNMQFKSDYILYLNKLIEHL